MEGRGAGWSVKNEDAGRSREFERTNWVGGEGGRGRGMVERD